MKVFRFMSINELKKYLNGEELINNKKHKAHTDSEGFCFMNSEDEDPEFAYDFLNGIVSDDLCAEFKTDKKNLNKSWGMYADPYGKFFDTITVDEYCTKKYSYGNFKLLRIAKIERKGYDYEFTWYKDITKGLEALIKQQKEREKVENDRQKRMKVMEELTTKSENTLREFIKEVNNKNKIEIKIKDRYYNVDAYIDCLKKDAYGPLRISLNLLIN